MEPGELAAYNLADNTMHISTTDVAKYSSWKEGLLIFRNEPIKTVFEKLERWYNVDIEVADEKVYESIFTGTIQNESYEQIFRLIKFSCPVKCSINHNSDSELIPKIIITKK
jgi:ferric-dicitrate binding protein FerR (iron transport regulator)